MFFNSNILLIFFNKKKFRKCQGKFTRRLKAREERQQGLVNIGQDETPSPTHDDPFVVSFLTISAKLFTFLTANIESICSYGNSLQLLSSSSCSKITNKRNN